MNTTTMRRVIASATLATGLAVGFAAAAHAETDNPWKDYAECALEHPDKIGQETCCILYGGTWDPSQYLYECSLDRGERPKPVAAAKLESLPELSVNPGPAAPPKGPKLTADTPVVSRG